MPLSIERVRKDAKALCDAWRANEAGALKRVQPYFPNETEPQLSRAQLVVARELLFDSWAQLVRADGTTQNDIAFAAREGDVERTRELLAKLTPIAPLAAPICFNKLYGPEEKVVECLALLFDAGCDPNAGVMSKGEKHTCLYGALEHGHQLIAALLRERGGVVLPTPE